MKFLNKLFGKAVFSEDSGLNITAHDLGEEMIKISFEDPVVNRLKTATGTVGSLSIFVAATAEIHVLKTSPIYENYLKRILENGYIGGTLTIYDDVNVAHEMEEISLDLSEVPTNSGTQAAVIFKAQGNLRVNRQALVGF